MIERAFWNFAALEGLRADDRLRVLSRAGAAVLFRLVLVSRGDGAVPYLNHHSGIASIAAYDLRESDLDRRDEAADAVAELIDAGVIALDDAARVIRLRLHGGALARDGAPAEAGEGSTPTSAPTRRRAPPSSTSDRARDRKARYQFNHRTGPFRSLVVSEGMTWETWSASPEGRAFLTRNDVENDPGTTPERVGNDPGNDPRNEAGTTRNDPGTTLSPTPPLRNGTEENQRENNPNTAGAREAGTTRNGNGNDVENDPRNGNGNEGRNDPGTTPRVVPGSGADASLTLVPLLPKGSKRSDDVERVFAHWQKVHEHPKAVLDKDRRNAILRALKLYSADTLCRAIDGYAHSPWHTGDNPKNKRFDDVALLLRNAGQIEQGLGYAEQHEASATAEADDFWSKGLRETAQMTAAARQQRAAGEVAHG